MDIILDYYEPPSPEYVKIMDRKRKIKRLISVSLFKSLVDKIKDGKYNKRL